MPLSAEERKQLKALQDKEKEPDSPPGNVNFNLDLSNDAAWERAKSLGIVREPASSSDDSDDNDDSDDDDNGTPKRPGYFGGR